MSPHHASLTDAGFEPLDTIIAGARLYFHPHSGEYALAREAVYRAASVRHVFAFAIMMTNRGTAQ